MKLKAEWTTKKGAANYGSIGAGVSMECELKCEPHEADKIQAALKKLFAECKSAVDRELAEKAVNGSSPSGNGQANRRGASRGHDNF